MAVTLAQSTQRFPRDWKWRDRFPVGGNFYACSDLHRWPPSSLYGGYLVCSGGRAPERVSDHSLSRSAEVANGLKLYLRLLSVPASARHGVNFAFLCRLSRRK